MVFIHNFRIMKHGLELKNKNLLAGKMLVSTTLIHGFAAVTTATSQQDDPGFEPDWLCFLIYRPRVV